MFQRGDVFGARVSAQLGLESDDSIVFSDEDDEDSVVGSSEEHDKRADV